MIAPGNFWFVFGGLWLAVGALFASIGGVVLWRDSTLEQRLALEGTTVPGVVLAKRMQGGRDQEPRFEIDYRFTPAAGALTEQTATIDGKTWDALVEGEPVAVNYVREAPWLNRIPGQTAERLILGIVFTGLGSLLAAAGGAILWWAAARRKLVHELAREGMRVDGEVVEVAPANFRINWTPQLTIRYRYRDHAGMVHEGKTPPLASEEAQRSRAGDRGEVRYERDRPQRSVWIGKG
jgi:Protein of unknown function (DUF3592)